MKTNLNIDIDKIGPQGLEIDQPVSPAWLADILEPQVPEQSQTVVLSPGQSGQLHIRLVRSQDTVYLQGEAQVCVHIPCSRCLGLAVCDLHIPMQLTLLPAAMAKAENDDATPQEQEITAESAEILHYRQGQIDLTSILRDEVFLALPMRNLCKIDCAGLCNTCGKNLNDGVCQCTPDIDERLAVLQHLKIKRQQPKEV